MFSVLIFYEREGSLTLVARWPVREIEHMTVAQNNEDCSISYFQFIRKPVKKHDPPKYWPMLMLFDFLRSNVNPAYWQIHYGTYKK